MNKVVGMLTLIIAVIFITSMVTAGEGGGAKPEYLGVAKCKMCHSSAKKGAPYKKWSASKHARAYNILAGEEAKAVAKKLGVEDPQKSGKCLKCHSTAYVWTESVVASKVKVEEGVGCGSCHGPGSKYKSMSVMKNHEKAVAAGLTNPKKACVKCHNADNPTWNAEKYTKADGTKTGFDYDQASKKIAHDNPLTGPVKW